MRIDNDRAERAALSYDDDDVPTAVMRRPSPAASAGASVHGERELRASRVFERIATSSDYDTLVAGVTATTATTGAAPLDRDRAVQRGLDDLRDRFSGPYVVNGETVTARPMFRMNHERPKEMTNAVWTAARKAGIADHNPNPIIWGQGSPAQLVKVTQALIDMGRLPAGPGDLASRIRQMQWEHGIGVDCAGYCKQALLATSPKPLPLRGPGNESFRDLDNVRARAFSRHDVVDVRPGDLMTLDAIPPEIYGHNVIVYRHDVADGATARALATMHGDAMKAFLSSPGPHHVIEVDSSWGAGAHGADYGGYRRDTWLFDASTKTWGYFAAAPPRPFVTSTEGPSGDRFHGAYRAR